MSPMIWSPFANALKSSALMRSPGERKGSEAKGFITGAAGTAGGAALGGGGVGGGPGCAGGGVGGGEPADAR